MMNKLTQKQINRIETKLSINKDLYVVLIETIGHKQIPSYEANHNIYLVNENDEIIWQVDYPPTGVEVLYEDHKDPFYSVDYYPETGMVHGIKFHQNEYLIDVNTGSTVKMRLNTSWSPPYGSVNPTDIVTAEEMKFLRFHKTCDEKYHHLKKDDLPKDDSIGVFMVREKNVQNILNDPEALRQYIAIDGQPAYVTEVYVPPQTRIRIGLANSQPNFGVKYLPGRFQYELLGRIPLSCYKNTKPIL